jgi:hypothetical protein
MPDTDIKMHGRKTTLFQVEINLEFVIEDSF